MSGLTLTVVLMASGRVTSGAGLHHHRRADGDHLVDVGVTGEALRAPHR
jgi:hypothetical protein